MNIKNLYENMFNFTKLFINNLSTDQTYFIILNLSPFDFYLKSNINSNITKDLFKHYIFQYE